MEAGVTAPDGIDSGGGPNSTTGHPDATPAGDATTSRPTTDAASDASAIEVVQLPSFPDATELGCTGPSYDGGYWGQCCADIVCRLPEGGRCPVGDDGWSYGSGSCLCGEGILGPFARPTDAPVDQEGECCYLTESIGCTGRPLRVDGRPRLAPLASRSDWGASVDQLESARTLA